MDPQSAYDANGNILAMMQKGLQINSSSAIDQLKYVYEEKSNRLKQVTDTANDYASTLGDFKYDGTKKTTTDYLYDADGNLTSDRNKQINGIVYNDLGLPSTIQVTGKGSINYFYNAAGMKLVKITRDSTSNPVKIDSTLYLGGGVFQNDTLQFIGQEEGRIRFNPTDSSLQYDYFLRDHLGNVRMVLTEEQRTDAYPAASLETASLTTEKNLYARLDSGRVNKSGVSGYPSDTYTSPNDYIQKLSGSGVKIGAGIVLKVMAGDEVGIRVSSWYRKNGSSPGTAVNPLTDLLGALTTGIGGISSTHGGATIAQLQDGDVLDAAVISFLGSQSTASGKPKAYVNWLLFDEQFKLISASSGFEQVGNDEEFKTHTPPAQSISKNGFLYIYVSNETPNIDVFFDNLQVTHTRGPLLEESHYYPFGLTMAGISNKSAGGLENKYKFNSGTELNSSFDINLYETNFRSLDPQLGRFWQVDPMAEGTVDWSTYAFANNNPIMFADPLGLDTTRTLRPKENADIGDIWMPFGDGIAFSYQGGGSWGLVNIIELGNVTIRSGHYDPLDTKGHHTKSTEEYLAMTEGANEYIKEHEIKSAPGESRSIVNDLSTFFSATGVTIDLTKEAFKGAQSISNLLSASKFAVTDIGQLKILKGITVNAAGDLVGWTGVALTIGDMVDNGINYKNSTDLVMGGASLIPGVGWVIGTAYFFLDPIVKSATGKDMSEHLEDAVNGTVSTYNGLVNWLNSVEQGLRKWRPN